MNMEKKKLTVIFASAVVLLALIIALVCLAPNVFSPDAETPTTDNTVTDAEENPEDSTSPDDFTNTEKPETGLPDHESTEFDKLPPFDPGDVTESTSPDPDTEDTADTDATDMTDATDSTSTTDPTDTDADDGDGELPEDDGRTVATLKYALVSEGTEYWVIGIETEGEVIHVPAEHEGLPVTAIGSRAFEGSTVQAVTVADGVKSIGSRAFYGCKSLKTLTLGKDVRDLSKDQQLAIDIFGDNESLESITVSAENPVYSAYDGVLYQNKPFEILYAPLAVAGKVTVPEGITRVNAFSERTKLTEIVLPSTVTHLGSFHGCTSLTVLHIPQSVTSITSGITANCKSLRSITVEEGNSFYRAVDNCLIREFTLLAGCNSSRLNRDTVVNRIATAAFRGLPGIVHVEFPESLTTVDALAFSDCKNLVSIVWNESLTEIGTSAFEGTALTDVIIPAGVQTLPYRCFYGCERLSTLHVGISLSAISDSTFYGCNLTSITVHPENATFRASSNCLIDIASRRILCGNSDGILPEEEEILTVASGAFCGRTNMTSLHIPVTVILEDYAFLDCPNLKTITYGTNSSGYSRYVVVNNGLIDTKTDTLILACNDTTIPVVGTVTKIASYAFSNCKEIESIYIPTCVTDIGYMAFYSCDNLKTVDVYDMSEWYQKRLHGAIHPSFTLTVNGSPVTEVTVPAEVTEIYDYIFAGMKELRSVTLHDGVTAIGTNAFWNCVSITSLSIPDSVTSIGSGAFANCVSITSLKLPASVTAIDSSVFIGMTSLEELALPCNGKLPDLISPDVSKQLKKITLLANSTALRVPANALEGFVSIETVVLGEGVSSVGASAFKGCTALESISLPSTITVVNSGAFEDCISLREIVFKREKEVAAIILASTFESYEADAVTIKCTDGILRSTDL